MSNKFMKRNENFFQKKLSLPKQIVIALILGIIVGFFFDQIGIPEFTTNYLKPIGTIFINLLKFIVVPVVLLSMIEGILSMGDMKKVGSIGWKTVAFFLVTTAIACVIGLAMGSIFNGAGLFPKLALADGATWAGTTSSNFMDTLVGMFPSNMWEAFRTANMLQVIVIALFLVLLCAYIAYALHAVLVYSMAAKAFAKTSPVKFFKGAFSAMIFAFTSTSSAATLPVSKDCARELGADDDVAAFVLPLGATINMDGTAIYQCVATIFLASCCGMSLTLGQMITVVVTATLASIGTAGVSGAGMIMLAMVLQAMGIPVDMIMIIYGVDRLFDMGRTCLNVTGDISGALCVSTWERKKAAKK